MWHETIAKLRDYTDTVEFERMCVDLLARNGFDIVPRGPGIRDYGADAESLSSPGRMLYQFSIQKDWKGKISTTLGTLSSGGEFGLKKHGVLIFVTNQKASPQEINSIKKKARLQYDYRAKILDIEWLRAQLDYHQDIRQTYLQIPVSSGFRGTRISYASKTLIDSFSVDDFIGHLMNLALVRRKPWRNLARTFCRERLRAYVMNELGRADTLELFPIGPGEPKVTQKYTFKYDDGTILKRQVTLAPILSKHESHPRDPHLFMATGRSKPLSFLLRSLPCGYLLLRPGSPLLGILGRSLMLMEYVNSVVTAHADEIYKRNKLDYNLVFDVMIEIEKTITGTAAASLANYMQRRERIDTSGLVMVIEEAYGWPAPSWFLSQFFGSLGEEYVRRIVSLDKDKERIEMLLGLLLDQRIPLIYYEAAASEAKKIGITYASDSWVAQERKLRK